MVLELETRENAGHVVIALLARVPKLFAEFAARREFVDGVTDDARRGRRI
ncbi:hypothetical protein [Nocardia terpenica]|nr:hypothetical protein [Nocardia terpenica]